MDEPTVRVLVLTDSLAFVGPRMPHPIDDPRLWPNIMARRLDVRVDVFGDFGWTARSGWYALGHDPRLWAAMRRADAVVLALGQFDTVPAPLPNVLWRLIPLIRSDPIRRAVTAMHLRAVPLLVRLFSHLPGGGPVSLPPRLTVFYLQLCLEALRRKRPGVPIVSMTPLVGRSDLYANRHPGRAAGERAMRRWAAAANVPLLDLPPILADHMLNGRGNPDGMHLGWEGHRILGAAMAELLTSRLPGRGAGSRTNGAVPKSSPSLSIAHPTAAPAKEPTAGS